MNKYKKINVLNALFLREMQTRFGSKSMGYFWVFVDAMAQIMMFSAIKLYLFENTLVGVDYSVFLTIGFLSYYLFKNIINKSMNAYEANQGLFVYRQVKLLDAILSRIVVEVFISSLVLMVFIFIGWFLEFDLEVSNLLNLILYLGWFVLFAMSLGLLFAVLGRYFENFSKAIGLIFLPLFFFSGLFYTIESLPPIAQNILLYNPIVHFIEAIHGSYFEVLTLKYVDHTYMLFWTMIPLFLGMFLYNSTKDRILSS